MTSVAGCWPMRCNESSVVSEARRVPNPSGTSLQRAPVAWIVPGTPTPAPVCSIELLRSREPQRSNARDAVRRSPRCAAIASSSAPLNSSVRRVMSPYDPSADTPSTPRRHSTPPTSERSRAPKSPMSAPLDVTAKSDACPRSVSATSGRQAKRCPSDHELARIPAKTVPRSVVFCTEASTDQRLESARDASNWNSSSARANAAVPPGACATRSAARWSGRSCAMVAA